MRIYATVQAGRARFSHWSMKDATWLHRAGTPDLIYWDDPHPVGVDYDRRYVRDATWHYDVLLPIDWRVVQVVSGDVGTAAAIETWDQMVRVVGVPRQSIRQAMLECCPVWVPQIDAGQRRLR